MKNLFKNFIDLLFNKRFAFFAGPEVSKGPAEDQDAIAETADEVSDEAQLEQDYENMRATAEQAIRAEETLAEEQLSRLAESFRGNMNQELNNAFAVAETVRGGIDSDEMFTQILESLGVDSPGAGVAEMDNLIAGVQRGFIEDGNAEGLLRANDYLANKVNRWTGKLKHYQEYKATVESTPVPGDDADDKVKGNYKGLRDRLQEHRIETAERFNGLMDALDFHQTYYEGKYLT
ncbi:hypothetical protein KJ742_06685 [Patescibacteria group bacterium]|nr:hypothetical protein [Patescibacteria group bacterium]MBU1683598.1 hypothetical protein [Patescibacteria group bacterium]MBU1934437.1 hypothetical protein [Patescibacteria group bacterium]